MICRIGFENRPLSKLAYAEGFEGDASPRTAAYYNSVTDSSTASLSKSPAEVEFRKRSINGIAILLYDTDNTNIFLISCPNSQVVLSKYY